MNRKSSLLPYYLRSSASIRINGFGRSANILGIVSKLAEAIDYVINRWEAFVRSTSDGRIAIDNNFIEQPLRPVAIGRKNY